MWLGHLIGRFFTKPDEKPTQDDDVIVDCKALGKVTGKKSASGKLVIRSESSLDESAQVR